MSSVTLTLLCQKLPILEKDGLEELALTFIQERVKYFFKDIPSNFQVINDIRDFEHTSEKSEDISVIVGLTLANPLLDEVLLKQLIAKAIEKNKTLRPIGEIPGTGPLFVATKDSFSGKFPVEPYECDTQRAYGTQLNISRLKRAKIFKLFTEKFQNLARWEMKDFLEYCTSPEGIAFILEYGSPVKAQYLKQCPLCNSSDTIKLRCHNGHPVTGFLTRKSSFYSLCRDCHLVYLNPKLPDSELWRYYDEYAYDNTVNRETLVKRFDNPSPSNISIYENYLIALKYIEELKPEPRLLDLGGGTGEFSVLAKKYFPSLTPYLMDYRINEIVQIELEERGICAIQGDFLNETLNENCYDLITNWEVIEHLPILKLEGYFKKINRSLTKNGLYILSTPDFDNPYCQALDFWAAYPGEHLSVLSRRVLEPLLLRCGFKIVGEHHESVTLKSAGRWFKYGADFDTSSASRAEAFIIDNLIANEKTLESFHQSRRKTGFGSELILVLRKID